MRPCGLVGDIDQPRLVTNKTGIDHTEQMLSWASGRLDALEKDGLCGFHFQKRFAEQRAAPRQGLQPNGPAGEKREWDCLPPLSPPVFQEHQWKKKAGSMTRA